MHYFITKLSDFNDITITQHDSLDFICKKCNKLYTIHSFRKERLNRYKELLCYKCHNILYAKQHPEYIKNKKESLKNAWKNQTKEQIQNRINNIRKSWNNKTDEEKISIFKKQQNKLKNKTLEEKAKIREKIKQTCLDRYGNENYNNREKCKQTKLERYNNPNYNNINKRYETNKIKYGCKSPLQNDEIKLKTKITNLNKFGYLTNLITPEQIFNTKKAKLYKYNTMSTSIRYNYYGIKFCSSWELIIWIYCIDHNVLIIKEPVELIYYDLNNKLMYYYPDFWIQGIGLVEIKGNQFWSKDNTNKMIFPYKRKIMDGKYYSEEDINYWNDTYERKHQCGLVNNVLFLKEKDMIVYKNYIESVYGTDYISKFKIKNPINPTYLNLYGYFDVTSQYNSISSFYSKPVFIKGVSTYDINEEDEYTFGNVTFLSE